MWKMPNGKHKMKFVEGFGCTLSVLNFYPPIEKCKKTTRTTIKPKQWQRKMETNNHLTKKNKTLTAKAKRRNINLRF